MGEIKLGDIPPGHGHTQDPDARQNEDQSQQCLMDEAPYDAGDSGGIGGWHISPPLYGLMPPEITR
jgi:hypothetical protein